MILIDMHVHSRCSDGTFTPEELAAAARRRGLSLLALTDHDTTAGLAPFMRACSKDGVKGLCGIELSAEAPFTLHILGYRISPGAGRLEERLDYIRERRDVRNLLICEKLRALGLDVAIDEVREISGGEVVARPHIARLKISRAGGRGLCGAREALCGGVYIAYPRGGRRGCTGASFSVPS